MYKEFFWHNSSRFFVCLTHNLLGWAKKLYWYTLLNIKIFMHIKHTIQYKIIQLNKIVTINNYHNKISKYVYKDQNRKLISFEKI